MPPQRRKHTLVSRWQKPATQPPPPASAALPHPVTHTQHLPGCAPQTGAGPPPAAAFRHTPAARCSSSCEKRGAAVCLHCKLEGQRLVWFATPNRCHSPAAAAQHTGSSHCRRAKLSRKNVSVWIRAMAATGLPRGVALWRARTQSIVKKQIVQHQAATCASGGGRRLQVGRRCCGRFPQLDCPRLSAHLCILRQNT